MKLYRVNKLAKPGGVVIEEEAYPRRVRPRGRSSAPRTAPIARSAMSSATATGSAQIL